MKDAVQFTTLLIIGLAIFAAAPVAGFVIGAGIGVWFLWNAWKEHRDAQRQNTRTD